MADPQDNIHPLHRKAVCPDKINEAIIKLDIKSTGCNRQRKFIYRSSTPCFNFHIFVEQFLKHLFFPFVDVLMFWKYGHRSNTNQSSRSIRDIFPYTFGLMIVLYGVFYDDLRENGVSVAEVVISALVGVAWRLVVALKYASMSPKEYVEFLTCHDDEEVAEIQSQMQLVTGWLSVDIPFCVHESNLALGRMGFYPESRAIPPYFIINRRDLSSWAHMLGSQAAELLAEGGHREIGDDIPVSVADLMGLIINSAQSKKVHRGGFVIAISMTMLFSCLPGLVRVTCSSISHRIVIDGADDGSFCPSTFFFGDGVFANLFSALVMFHASLPMLALNLFFLAALSGSVRNFYASNMLSDLVRIDTESKSLEVAPVINLQNPNNIRAWVRARLTLHYFGKRYINRIDLYTKMCAIILVLLVGWVYIHSKAMPDNGGYPNRLLVDVRYWTVFYFIIVWGGAFLAILSVMAATNFELVQQEIEFLLHRLTVREEAEHIEVTNAEIETEEEMKVDDHDSTTPDSADSVKDFEKNPLGAEWFEVIFGEDATIVPNSSLEGATALPSSTSTAVAISAGSESIDAVPCICSGASESSPVTTARKQATNDSYTRVDTKSCSIEVETNNSTSSDTKFEELDDLLDTVVLIVEAQSRVDPRRFLGAEISWNIVISFVAAWASMIGLALTVAGLDYSFG